MPIGMIRQTHTILPTPALPGSGSTGLISDPVFWITPERLTNNSQLLHE